MLKSHRRWVRSFLLQLKKKQMYIITNKHRFEFIYSEFSFLSMRTDDYYLTKIIFVEIYTTIIIANDSRLDRSSPSNLIHHSFNIFPTKSTYGEIDKQKLRLLCIHDSNDSSLEENGLRGDLRTIVGVVDEVITIIRR